MAAYIPMNIVNHRYVLPFYSEDDKLSLKEIIESVYKRSFSLDSSGSQWQTDSEYNYDYSTTASLQGEDLSTVENWLVGRGNAPLGKELLIHLVKKGFLPYGRYKIIT